MKVFICGGGSGEQTRRAIHRLNEVIRHDLPSLYIPLAMEEERYDNCYEWITGELAGVEIPGIETYPDGTIISVEFYGKQF